MTDRADTQDVPVRLVYYGPGLSGKTESLRRLAEAAGRPGDLTEIETASPDDRCEYLPLLRPGSSRPLQLIAVPGRLARAEDRLRLLRGVDGVVFVADGRPERQDANLVLLDELGTHLAARGFDPAGVPLVFQYNHRDLSEAVAIADLERLLNGRRGPAIPTSALTGAGIQMALDALLSIMSRR